MLAVPKAFVEKLREAREAAKLENQIEALKRRLTEEARQREELEGRNRRLSLQLDEANQLQTSAVPSTAAADDELFGEAGPGASATRAADADATVRMLSQLQEENAKLRKENAQLQQENASLKRTNRALESKADAAASQLKMERLSRARSSDGGGGGGGSSPRRSGDAAAGRAADGSAQRRDSSSTVGLGWFAKAKAALASPSLPSSSPAPDELPSAALGPAAAAAPGAQRQVLLSDYSKFWRRLAHADVVRLPQVRCTCAWDPRVCSSIPATGKSR